MANKFTLFILPACIIVAVTLLSAAMLHYASLPFGITLWLLGNALFSQCLLLHALHVRPRMTAGLVAQLKAMHIRATQPLHLYRAIWLCCQTRYALFWALACVILLSGTTQNSIPLHLALVLASLLQLFNAMVIARSLPNQYRTPVMLVGMAICLIALLLARYLPFGHTATLFYFLPPALWPLFLLSLGVTLAAFIKQAPSEKPKPLSSSAKALTIARQ